MLLILCIVYCVMTRYNLTTFVLFIYYWIVLYEVLHAIWLYMCVYVCAFALLDLFSLHCGCSSNRFSFNCTPFFPFARTRTFCMFLYCTHTYMCVCMCFCVSSRSTWPISFFSMHIFTLLKVNELLSWHTIRTTCWEKGKHRSNRFPWRLKKLYRIYSMPIAYDA